MLSGASSKEVRRIRDSALFDQGWYVQAYPDVVKSGMDPAEHFYKYGGILRRDPGPKFSSAFHLDTRPGCAQRGLNPLTHFLTVKSAQQAQYHYVLWAAYNVANKGDYIKAISLAKKHLPEDLQYTLNILLANQAIEQGDEQRWLNHVNSYLGEFGASPISLSGSGHILGRLNVKKLNAVWNDVKVSVIMPAWNAENTVRHAAQSILNQTHANLELIIVDDASQDGTWEVVKSLIKKDSRVLGFRNKINVGPYVSKNLALRQASGHYVTGHDADDWAHPQRLEQHLSLLKDTNYSVKASLTYMIRIQPSGFFGHIGKITGFSFDGVARKASISCLFEKRTLEQKLGYWDSVRFGADSEMIARAKNVLGDSYREYNNIGMICLDLESSLTNHAEHGVDKVNGVSPIRKNYRDSWDLWHKEKLTLDNAFLPFPLQERRYRAAEEMVVDPRDSMANMR